jgi:transcriptional regulator with XRE-family HTH domain
MFDMKRIGGNISRMRKAANLTQMELADRMGVSFQAVSNWERGQTMPDISRLSELAEALNTTVDAILGNRQAADLLEKLEKNEETPQLTGEEIQDVAPLLRPEQADKVAKNADLSFGELAGLAPFVSQEVLEEIALDHAGAGSIHELAAIAPFLSEETLAKIAENVLDDGAGLSSLASIAPFLDGAALGRLAEKLVDDGGKPSELAVIAPFVDEQVLGRIAEKMLDDGAEASDFAPIAPFLGQEAVSRIALAIIREEGIMAAMPLMPFVDSTKLDDQLKSAFGRKRRW